MLWLSVIHQGAMRRGKERQDKVQAGSVWLGHGVSHGFMELGQAVPVG